MPELPEVETVRRGLDSHVVGRVIESVTIGHPRAVRRHLPGPLDLAGRLAGQQVTAAHRRGKYLWLTFGQSPDALVVHLGMSGQLLVQPAAQPREKHAHIVAPLDNATELRFIDQRTFGGWSVAPLADVDGTMLPEPVAHIARDPLDPRFDPGTVIKQLRGKHSEIKRVLLDQTVISGIGNIYADESLWRAGLHGARPAAGISRSKLVVLLDAVRAVMDEALAAGGTSFDALYVNVNGQSGYFERSLAAYGRESEPCRRCGAAIRREAFMGRSSYSCPRCQRAPR